MRVRVSCAGIDIGEAEFEPAEGVAHARLVPAAGYAIAQDAARRAGLAISHTQHWSPLAGDFADAAASLLWTGDRLALTDELARELGVASVVVLERPEARAVEPLVTVVADFRPDLARVEAFLRTLDGGGGGRARPAA